MKFPMHFPQAAARNVSVDFSGVNICVTEQFLDDTQIRAVLQ